VTATDAVLHWIGVLLYLYSLVFFARFIMSLVLAMSRYRPSGAAAVAFEFVYTLTDPPLRLLHRWIPDLTIGRVSMDMSFILIVVGLSIVAQQLL
jgi:YggT family protein